jgi:hypothetical protein
MAETLFNDRKDSQSDGIADSQVVLTSIGDAGISVSSNAVVDSDPNNPQ